jgi:hypothetical protein
MNNEIGVNELEINSSQLEKKERQARSIAREPLPTNRADFETQLKLLRAYANASENGVKAVALDRLASISQISGSVASSANAFFKASNFITKDKDGYKPTSGIIEFATQVPWNEDKAKLSLRELMVKDTWYIKELQILFGVNPQMDQEALTNAIGSSIGADPSQKTSITILIKFLSYAGIISQDLDTGKFKFIGSLPLGESDSQIENKTSSLHPTDNIAVKDNAVQKSIISMTKGKVEFIVNVNLKLDITLGSPEEYIDKINKILNGIKLD